MLSYQWPPKGCLDNAAAEMTSRSPEKKWPKIFIIILAAFLLFIGVPFLFINSYLTHKLSEKLKTAVLTGSDGLYHIDFSKAEIHLFSGDAALYDISLSPDTAVYRRMQLAGNAPPQLLQLKVNRLNITGTKAWSLYFDKKLEIKQVDLDGPQVQLARYTDSSKKAPVKDNRTLYQKLAKSLKLISVGVIKLNNIHLVYKTFTGPKPKVSSLQNMNLTATALLIDSATQFDKTRTLFCKEIETRLNGFNGSTADGLYKFRFRSVNLSTSKSLLTLTGVEMLPITANRFFDKSDWDRYTLRLDSVAISDVTFNSIQKHSDLDVSKITIDRGFFNVYSNPNVPGKKSDRVATYPNWVVSHMKQVINVDTVNFRHLNISYTEYNKQAANSGTIAFDNTTGRFFNITNKKESIAAHHYSTVSLTSYLMGKGRLNLSAAFNLQKGNYGFNYKGHMGPIDLHYGNAVLVPLGLVKAQSGTIQSFDFDIRATKKTATGKVTLLYQNLKAELLRHNEDGYSKKTLVSLFANLIILKSNNPDKPGAAPRVANIVYVRPLATPFFASIWQTLLNGIKECAGVGKADKPAAAPVTAKEQKQQAKAIKKAQKKADKENKKHLKDLLKLAKKRAKTSNN